MAQRLQRKDFVIKDLVVGVAGGSRGGTWLPADDGEPPPTPVSPIASVLVNITLIESVRAAMIDAIRAKDFDSIGRAFVQGEAGGNAAIRMAIQEIGQAVVAAAAYSAMGGGSAGMPNPDDDQPIPTPLTPVIHVGFEVHRVSELPRLRKQLAATLEYVDKAVAARTPHGSEVGMVREQLEVAIKALGR